MGTILKIAFRNTLRHKRRTFLTAIIISMGLFIFIWFDSLLSGMDRNSIENMVNLTESSIKVYSSDYDRDRNALPLKYGISDYKRLESFLLNLKGVTGVTPRTSFLGEMTSGPQALHVVGTVIDPVKDKSVFTTSKYIVKGRYFSANSVTEILLGVKLAEDMKVNVGDTVTLRSQTRFEANNAVDFEVAGLIDCPHPAVNEGGAYITYQAADPFLDIGGIYPEADIHADWKKGESSDDYLTQLKVLKNQIKQSFPDAAPYTFNDLQGAFLALLKQKGTSGNIMSLLILLIAAIGIVNSVLMSVYERIREVGVLKAMGIKPGEILRMFMYEGIIIGLIGSLFGLLLAFITNIWMVTAGMDMSSMLKGVSSSSMGMPVSTVFYGQWNPGTFIGMFIFGMIISVAAAYVPARKAAKMPATDCLHFV